MNEYALLEPGHIMVIAMQSRHINCKTNGAKCSV